MRLRTDSFLGQWLEAAKPTLRPRTWQRYEEIVRLHLVPSLGRLPLARLGPQDLQRCYAAATARGLSPRSVRCVHMVLHRALGQAERWRLITRSPAALVDALGAPRPEVRVLDAAQVRTFLGSVTGHRREALYVVALATGMRQGELLALHWRDVDLDRAVVAVTGTLQRHPEEGLKIAEPKTARSRRQVHLGATAVDALRRHRTAQLAERLRAGSEWGELDLVFATRVGGVVDAHDVRIEFTGLLERAGLPRVRFHDLRHTAATLLLEQGIHPKVAADMLGHATVAVTLDTYSHVTPGMHEAAADALDAVLRTRPGNPAS